MSYIPIKIHNMSLMKGFIFNIYILNFTVPGARQWNESDYRGLVQIKSARVHYPTQHILLYLTIFAMYVSKKRTLDLVDGTQCSSAYSSRVAALASRWEALTSRSSRRHKEISLLMGSLHNVCRKTSRALSRR
jgi:hypothetical protein